jgi:hypothetical protein
MGRCSICRMGLGDAVCVGVCSLHSSFFSFPSSCFLFFILVIFFPFSSLVSPSGRRPVLWISLVSFVSSAFWRFTSFSHVFLALLVLVLR